MSISPHFEMSGDEAKGLLYGLMESNKIQLRKYPDLPSMRDLVASGRVRYERLDPNEDWQTYKAMVDAAMEDGTALADCEDLACAIAAEDQIRYGVQSLPFAYEPQPGLFHVVVAVPDAQYGALPRGSWPAPQRAPSLPGYVLEDPSLKAGMTSFGATGTAFGGVRRGPGPGRGARRRGVGALLGSFRQGLRSTSPRMSLREASLRAGEAAGDELSMLFEAVPGLADVDPDEDPDAWMESDVSEDDDEDLDDFDFDLELDEDDDEDVFGWEVTGSADWIVDQIANRVSDDMDRGEAFGLLVPGTPPSYNLFDDPIYEPLSDVDGITGPRSANAPRPWITYGDLGASRVRGGASYGKLQDMISQLRSAPRLTSRLEDALREGLVALRDGNEVEISRLAMKIQRISGHLEGKGKSARSRPDVRSWMAFLRHKDEDRLRSQLSGASSSKKYGGGGRLDVLLAEIDSDIDSKFGALPAHLIGRAEMRPVMAAGIDTGAVVPMPLDPGIELSMDAVHEGFEEFLAQRRRR